jgi:hypothetical protein
MLKIHHETIYRYRQPVSLGPHRAVFNHSSLNCLLARSVSERSSANNCCERCWPRAALTASERMIACAIEIEICRLPSLTLMVR